MTCGFITIKKLKQNQKNKQTTKKISLCCVVDSDQVFWGAKKIIYVLVGNLLRDKQTKAN